MAEIFANSMHDQRYSVVFNLTGGPAPGKHMMVFMSSPNRVMASKHLKQIVDAHNNGYKEAGQENVMSIESMTPGTVEEIDEAVKAFKTSSDPLKGTDVDEVYPAANERNKLISPPSVKREGAEDDSSSSLNKPAEFGSLPPETSSPSPSTSPSSSKPSKK